MARELRQLIRDYLCNQSCGLLALKVPVPGFIWHGSHTAGPALFSFWSGKKTPPCEKKFALFPPVYLLTKNDGLYVEVLITSWKAHIRTRHQNCAEKRAERLLKKKRQVRPLCRSTQNQSGPPQQKFSLPIARPTWKQKISFSYSRRAPFLNHQGILNTIPTHYPHFQSASPSIREPLSIQESLLPTSTISVERPIYPATIKKSELPCTAHVEKPPLTQTRP